MYNANRWDRALSLEKDGVREVASSFLDEAAERGLPDSRFLTVVGLSSNIGLDTLCSLVEASRFSQQFGNNTTELEELYDPSLETVCIVNLDRSLPDNPRPATSSRLTPGHVNSLSHLPTMQSIVTDVDASSENWYREPTWHIQEQAYERLLGLLASGGTNGVILDASTIASMPGYKDGTGSMPVFSAYARMQRLNYGGFKDGIFMTTIAGVVAGLVEAFSGYQVFEDFPGTSPQMFLGAEGTTPKIGRVIPSKFGKDLVRRLATQNEEVDPDGATYLFL